MEAESEKLDKHSSRAIALSLYYGGKFETIPKVPIKDLSDFSVYYTPGVAAVSTLVSKDKDLSFEYTSRWNTVGVISDGSRVLGLGDIGPEGALPVMEGKALLYKYLGGVDAIPMTINVHEPDKIVEVVSSLEPFLGGVNLEDISSPKCFPILEKLREGMKIPVWHDDQQGTAGVTLAGLLNALKITGRNLKESRIVFFGSGAANIATARLLITAGADPGNVILVDSKGILHPNREDMDRLMLHHPWKYDLARKTNRERIEGSISEALDGADAIIAASRPGPRTIEKTLLRRMEKNPVVFVLANPVPEIWPGDAKEMGAKVVATGRSDFPNQVNNSLIFPGVFRGVLDVRAKTITDGMIVAAAHELASYAEEKGLSDDYIIPSMVEWEVYPRVAARVAHEAVLFGLARRAMGKEEAYARAKSIIGRSRRIHSAMMEKELIPKQP